MRRNGPSPLAPVGADDEPMGFCGEHHAKYPLYGQGSGCPECQEDDDEDEQEDDA